MQQGIAALRDAATATPGLGQPVTVANNPRDTVALVEIPHAGDGTDKVSEAALARLRDDVIPATIGRADGAQVNVTGMSAGSKDFNEALKSHRPLVFGFVLGLSLLLLLVTFRSLVIPIKAIILNLLSVGASYGVLKLVFQDGHGESLLGSDSIGGITAWLPLFLFVILFGLSMNYHVFILSRIREAVVGGDATIVRAVLLPATMKLLGDWNRYLPSGVSWLPTLRHDPTPTPEPANA